MSQPKPAEIFTASVSDLDRLAATLRENDVAEINRDEWPSVLILRQHLQLRLGCLVTVMKSGHLRLAVTRIADQPPEHVRGMFRVSRSLHPKGCIAPHPWEKRIAAYAKGRASVTTEEILAEALNRPPEGRTKAAQMLVGVLLRNLGWEPRRVRVDALGGRQARVWYLTGTPAEPPVDPGTSDPWDEPLHRPSL